MIIADETDAAAMAKWEHYKAGTDVEALAYRDAQAEDDPSTRPLCAAQPAPHPGRRQAADQPGRVGRLLCLRRSACSTSWPRCPGVRGVMLTFDDFVIGMEQFGTRILPLMRSRTLVGRKRLDPPPHQAGAPCVAAQLAAIYFVAARDRNRPDAQSRVVF